MEININYVFDRILRKRPAFYLDHFLIILISKSFFGVSVNIQFWAECKRVARERIAEEMLEEEKARRAMLDAAKLIDYEVSKMFYPNMYLLSKEVSA